MLSQTEENYLKAIYHLSDVQERVSTNALAEQTRTTPASVNDMIKRLDQKGIIQYTKYKGVTLTPSGKKTALTIIRKHRLWEVFLVDKLGFNWDEVHDIAEQLEHVHSPALTQKLDEFLGFPGLDPHGDPIPDAQGGFKPMERSLLTQLPIGTPGVVVAVTRDHAELLQHLDELGIHLGMKVEVVKRTAFDGSHQVRAESKTFFISQQVAENLMISSS